MWGEGWPSAVLLSSFILFFCILHFEVHVHMLKQCSKLQINVKYKWPFARWKLNYEGVEAGGWVAGCPADGVSMFLLPWTETKRSGILRLQNLCDDNDQTKNAIAIVRSWPFPPFEVVASQSTHCRNILHAMLQKLLIMLDCKTCYKSHKMF